MERHASCSAWDEDHETDDVMAEVLTRSASAAQREAREPLPPPSLQPEPTRTRPKPIAERACACAAGREAGVVGVRDRPDPRAARAAAKARGRARVGAPGAAAGVQGARRRRPRVAAAAAQEPHETRPPRRAVAAGGRRDRPRVAPAAAETARLAGGLGGLRGAELRRRDGLPATRACVPLACGRTHRRWLRTQPAGAPRRRRHRESRAILGLVVDRSSRRAFRWPPCTVCLLSLR